MSKPNLRNAFALAAAATVGGVIMVGTETIATAEVFVGGPVGAVGAAIVNFAGAAVAGKASKQVYHKIKNG